MPDDLWSYLDYLPNQFRIYLGLLPDVWRAGMAVVLRYRPLLDDSEFWLIASGIGLGIPLVIMLWANINRTWVHVLRQVAAILIAAAMAIQVVEASAAGEVAPTLAGLFAFAVIVLLNFSANSRSRPAP
jgi:hypothetical protein